ncbi:GNAT family N-acetyltransferase [Salinimicrobium soli]|uniref:GNAT family N-acetyltransferase n=1 Tax=Salinimicrobium soli TaxID=1254399 RepID=UPI003AABC5BB
MRISLFKPQYAEDFKELNLEWLRHFFVVEPHDEEVLGNPEKYIIEPGGNIFFVEDEGKIVATVALMKMEDGVFELTKMAVSPEVRGKKIGQKLMAHTLEYARSQNWYKLIIYSNRRLENAIYIYKKFGFKEIPLEKDLPYDRADIKMELQLS